MVAVIKVGSLLLLEAREGFVESFRTCVPPGEYSIVYPKVLGPQHPTPVVIVAGGLRAPWPG
jgi:hypothetical protein